MGRVVVFLAEGFEEIEALTPVDVLRRADIEVWMVGVGGEWITSSHGVCVKADSIASDDFALPEDTLAVVLPGGMPGTLHLRESEMVQRCVKKAVQNGLVLAAICAAPSVPAAQGLLAGKRYTAFPGVLENASGAAVEVDGKLITARGAGVALAFSKAVLAALKGEDVANRILGSMQAD